MQLHVFKYEGAGNDFVVIDDRDGRFPTTPDAAAWIRHLCDRRRGVGADGVLLLRGSDAPGFDFRMAYFNADGGEAEMCGNGARCIASFASRIGAAKDAMRFQTCAGPYEAHVLEDGQVSVGFPPVTGTPVPMRLEAGATWWEGRILVVGVPHLVVPVPDVGVVDVERIGRELRFHPDLGPDGANVNFAQIVSNQPAVIRVRTYERGVEGETLACGTGAVATALCLAAPEFGHNSDGCAFLQTRGGGRLSVIASRCDGGFSDCRLVGGARLVFVADVEWTDSIPPV